jgi:polyhydroxybutyrate depolymerase
LTQAAPDLTLASMRRLRHLAIGIVVLGLAEGSLAGCAALRARAGAGAAATGLLGAGDHRVALEVGGRRRDYVLHVPAGLPAGPRPLVLELHGGGGTAANIERLTGLQAETDARGWLVARPDGVDRQWNDGRPEVRAGIDDVAFLSAVIDDVATRTPLDPARVYATGISNGALMSGRLACELADRIAAVGQVAGTQGVELAVTCRPSRPVSVLVISGTADPLVPYAGGPIGPVLGLGGSRGTVLGAEAYVAAWVARDRAGPPTTTELAPDTTVSRYRSIVGSEVVFYRVDGAGHTWPGGRQYLSAALVGATTRTFSASRVIVDFFAAQ